MIKPNFLNLFMNKLTRDLVVPTISAFLSSELPSFVNQIPASWLKDRKSVV